MKREHKLQLLSFTFFLVSFLNLFAQEALTIRVPNSTNTVGRNELIEIEVPLNDNVWSAIDLFDSLSTEGYNPYNPEDIDVEANFYFYKNGEWNWSAKVFGFYYVDFELDTTGSVEDWHWDKQIGSDRFLVRFSPNIEGRWRVDVTRRIRGRDVQHPLSLEFQCHHSRTTGKLLVKDRHFEVDGKTFMPIGNNLAHPRWMEDPNTLRQGTAEYWYDIRKMPAMPIAYMNYLNDIKNFSASGGNYFRMLLFPFANDIEFEHLNNYSNRLHIAWEMDRLFELLEREDVRIHFVLTWANELQHGDHCYNKVFWNWYGNDYPFVDDDYGYCYHHELGLNDPHEFLTNELAITNYERKLRYMFSRWGYSKSLGTIEMMNEINLVFPDHPRERMHWHNEISSYLKRELGLPNPISVNYAGPPRLDEGDSSYYLSTVDVLTFNEYRIPGSRANFTKHLRNYWDLEKPFMFSEIGAGYGELTSCEQYSEWIKDAWMTTISGMAGMGLEWSQQRNFELMKEYYPVIDQFISNIDMALFTELETDIRKDKLAEVVAVKNLEASEALGVVHNTTWNYFTNRTSDEVPCAQTEPTNKVFMTYADVNDRKGRNALHLTGFDKTKRYRIEWFDVQSGEKVAITVDRSSLSGKIRIRIPTLNKELPMLAFKLRRD